MRARLSASPQRTFSSRRGSSTRTRCARMPASRAASMRARIALAVADDGRPRSPVVLTVPPLPYALRRVTGGTCLALCAGISCGPYSRPARQSRAASCTRHSSALASRVRAQARPWCTQPRQSPTTRARSRARRGRAAARGSFAICSARRIEPKGTRKKSSQPLGTD